MGEQKPLGKTPLGGNSSTEKTTYLLSHHRGYCSRDITVGLPHPYGLSCRICRATGNSEPQPMH